ncbi:MAG: cold shock domain-containing protein [Methylococcales bacterium]|nr:cold shock domain-containing protein [Methylococcales bacterium]
MIKGVLKTWKEDRGFGFIKPEDGGKDIFIHISALKAVSRRPTTGDVIYYQIARDNRGKYKAINARIEGVSQVEDKAVELQKLSISKKITIATALILIVIVVIFIFIYQR